MSPNTESDVRTVHADADPTGRGWWVVTEETGAGTAANVSFTRGLGRLFGHPELLVRGLCHHQARSLLKRVAERLLSSPFPGRGPTPTRLTAGHYEIEVAELHPSGWVEAADSGDRVQTLEVVWSSRLVEAAAPASAVA